MEVLRKIAGKKIVRITSQQIRESSSIQPVNEWVERRRREWDEHVTGMNVERLVKISRGNKSTRRRFSARPKKNMK